MDSIIRNIITIGLPALMLLIARVATGKTGDAATWSALRKLGGSFGMLIGLCVLVLVGFVANSFSYFVIDSLLVRFYQKRRELEQPEQLVIEVDKLPITNDLKIKLKWALLHSPNQIISLKHLILKWFMLATIVEAILSITGYLGEFNLLFELSSHFKLQYLLAGLSIFIFFALVRAKKIWLLVSAFCLILNLAEIVPWYLPGPAFAGATPGQHLRILHSNVLTSNRRYSEVISLVKAEQPDIAVFVEVSRVWAKELAVLSEMFPYSCHYQESERFGSAIYSKLPLNNSSVKLFSKGRKSLFAEVEFQGKIISLILAHPTIPIKQQSFIQRNRQLADIGEYAAQVKNPLIVVGDFNTTMWSPFYKNMVKTGNLRNARSGFGILPTWPTFMPLAYIPIDHFLVSKEIGVLKIRTGRNVGSDHLPLITDLVI
ncbi:endonuclease/exonuclease/phosphatase family protein [Microcoleus sp. K1-B6]|uniref:endonuclease/exonuclease/phosphatase family protein n=1 Tax=unclassified Microcoleus TaxID=2642155 RepID=UPI002FD3EB9D